MEAKDKAKALVDKFYDAQCEVLNKQNLHPLHQVEVDIAKQCALIACAEMKNMVSRNDENAEKIYDYLRDVENGINQL